MDLNKLMQLAMEHHNQEQAKKLQYNACFELLANIFIRTIPPTQRIDQLNISMQNVIDNAGYLNSEEEEGFCELMGLAKNMVIEMADKMEASR